VKTKKIPMRKCLVSQELFPKEELLRIVKTPNDEVVVDVSGKINGRGAYIYPSVENFEKAKKNKVLEKALEIKISDDVYERIEKVIKAIK